MRLKLIQTIPLTWERLIQLDHQGQAYRTLCTAQQGIMMNSMCDLQILYSLATQRFSRGTLFNMVIATFMVWFVAFGLMYPHHETIHFHGFAEETLRTLPSGLAGAVGMVSFQKQLLNRSFGSRRARVIRVSTKQHTCPHESSFGCVTVETVQASMALRKALVDGHLPLVLRLNRLAVVIADEADRSRSRPAAAPPAL